MACPAHIAMAHVNAPGTCGTRLASHVNRLPPHVNRLGSDVSRPGRHVSRLASRANRRAHHVNRLESDVSRLARHVNRLARHDSALHGSQAVCRDTSGQLRSTAVDLLFVSEICYFTKRELLCQSRTLDRMSQQETRPLRRNGLAPQFVEPPFARLSIAPKPRVRRVRR